MNVDLTRSEARYLSVLAAQDIRRDRERAMVTLVGLHAPAWEKLQAACEWDEPEDLAGPVMRV